MRLEEINAGALTTKDAIITGAERILNDYYRTDQRIREENTRNNDHNDNGISKFSTYDTYLGIKHR